MSLVGRAAMRPSTLASGDWDEADWIARRMVLDAGAEAARLRRQASVQAAAVCEAAEREAEVIWRQASAQAAVIRETAERETAELRAAVMRLSAAPCEPAGADGDVASQQMAATRTAVKPAAKPEVKPGTRREPGPGTRPVRRPQGTPRQLVAIRVAAVATTALFLIALTGGTVEVALHGFAFFVFRSAGTGETGPNGLKEDQGPGQPDAPKPTPGHIETGGPGQCGHREQRLIAQGGKKGSHGGWEHCR
jgi:hypothetical protein